MKMLSKLEWWSPEKVTDRARGLGRKAKKADFPAFIEKTLADPRWLALSAAFDAFIAEARKGPVAPDAGGGILKRIEAAIESGYPWLGDLLALDPNKLDRESKGMLKMLGVPDPRAAWEAYLEAGACALAVLENANYQMTRLKGFLAIEEKALIAYHQQTDALFERAFKACEALVRQQATLPDLDEPGKKRKGRTRKS